MNFGWLKDRIINLIIYGTIIIVVGFLLYSAFLKPTTTSNSRQQASNISNSLAGATIKIGFGGCARFNGLPKEYK